MSKHTINHNNLSDDEFTYLWDIEKRYGFERPHTPLSDDDRVICNSLTNHGVFSKNADGFYTLTQAGKDMLDASENTQ